MKKTYTTTSDKETKKLAVEFASSLKGGEVVALAGELGTGKTTFVQGVAKALGSKDRVRSPSFTLVNIYKCHHPLIKEIVHVDLYRLHQELELGELGLEDYQDRDDVVVFVEWPKYMEWLGKVFAKVLKIDFSYLEMDERKITIY